MTSNNSASSSGFVALVGAGPGDPELITLKAVRHLKRADVVYADALANRAVLEHCSQGVRVVDVGKRAGGRAVPQSVICDLLVDDARRGRYVVRLKGGDPFVLGRGGEEALFLKAHQVRFEVVPGISSAIAVPALAHIPVTHRGLSQQVTIVTGTCAHDDEALAARWSALAQAGGTLVFLMALRPLDKICARLIAAGLSPSQPACMVQSGSLPEQRIVDGTLSTLARAVAAAGLQTPALLVVGDVLAVRAALRAPAPADAAPAPLPARPGEHHVYL